jgi:hypothetical protein
VKIGKKKGTLAVVFFSTTFVFVSVYLEAGGCMIAEEVVLAVATS